ncbi:hypothetical protein SprV_0902752700 [Sparganum proliferum]
MLDTDAGEFAIGAVLSQVGKDGVEHPICFASNTLTKTQRDYCTFRRELLAIIVFIRRFKHLFGRRFFLRTDHRALQWLRSIKDTMDQIARWQEFLQDFDFECQFRPGHMGPYLPELVYHPVYAVHVFLELSSLRKLIGTFVLQQTLQFRRVIGLIHDSSRAPLVSGQGDDLLHLPNSQTFSVFCFENPARRVEADEVMVSFDVVSLFTSIPPDLAIDTLDGLLREKYDETDQQLKRVHIIELLELCLKTFFTLKGQVYEQNKRTPMGSPLSRLIAEAVLQRLERLVFSSYSPKFWARYVDDTFVIIKRSDVQDFKALLNSIFPDIQFTMEEEVDNRLPFLDVQVTKLSDGNIKTTVYRKATNTRRILHFRSNHPVGHKRSCVRTLFQRAQTHCSDDDDRKKEVKYLRALFEANGYPKSFIRKCLRKSHYGRSNEEKPKFWLSIPYVKNVSEATSRILKPFGIGVAHKPASTIRQQIMRPKDPLPVTEQSAVVYSILCQDCDASYVGETGKRPGTRLHEHQLAINHKDKLSLVYGHTLERNHNFAFEKARVVGRANDKMARLMMESASREARVSPGRANGTDETSHTGSMPTLADREGADRKSRDRRGTLSHGRSREAGNSMPEEQRSISPPSDEGEADENADAAATTLGVRETQGTPVRQWLRSKRPQSANKKQANQQTALDRFYGHPKVHKECTPLRPIVSLKFTPTYGLAKWLFQRLKFLTADSDATVSSSTQFLEQLKGVSLLPNDVMVSFDVTSLFTSIPEGLAVETVELLLRSKYNEPENGLVHAQVLQLLEFCLKTYFTFDETIYEQVKGTPMGSPISGFIAEAVL